MKPFGSAAGSWKDRYFRRGFLAVPQDKLGVWFPSVMAYYYSTPDRDTLWDNYYTAAPERLRPSAEPYNAAPAALPPSLNGTI